MREQCSFITQTMVPLFRCTGCTNKLPGEFRASGKPHPVDAAWSALSNPPLAWWNWSLIQWANHLGAKTVVICAACPGRGRGGG